MPLSAAVMGVLLALCFLLMLVTQKPSTDPAELFQKLMSQFGYWMMVTATGIAATILLYFTFTLELVFT